MIKIYTPKEWSSVFDCPGLMIDDDGLIWKADEYYKLLFGEPCGRIDYAAGKIYGADMGHGMMAQPIACMEEKNGVTEIRDAKAGYFSAPILYLKDGKIYTPDQYFAVFDCPGAYIRKEEKEENQEEYKKSEPAEAGMNQGESQSAPAGSGSGSGILKLGGILFAIYLVVQGVFVGAPWLGWALPIGTTAFLLYKGYTLPESDPRKKKSQVLGMIMGVITAVAMIALAACL